MKQQVKTYKQLLQEIPKENIIYITMYLHPVVYENSKVIMGSMYYDEASKRFHTNVNPYREINGPLSEYGEELEPPIETEYNEFVEDCASLVEAFGFRIIKRYRSDSSEKSEYLIIFGIDDTPYGAIVYDLRISDHPFDATFPDEMKGEVLEFLKMNNILDESATKAGINFTVEQILVGGVVNDRWDRAFNRLNNKLRHMKNKIKKQIKAKR